VAIKNHNGKGGQEKAPNLSTKKMRGRREGGCKNCGGVVSRQSNNEVQVAREKGGVGWEKGEFRKGQSSGGHQEGESQGSSSTSMDQKNEAGRHTGGVGKLSPWEPQEKGEGDLGVKCCVFSREGGKGQKKTGASGWGWEPKGGMENRARKKERERSMKGVCRLR